MEDTSTEEVIDQSSDVEETEGTTEEDSSMASQTENAEQAQSQDDEQDSEDSTQDEDSSQPEEGNETQRNDRAERVKASKLESENARIKREKAELSQAAQAYQVMSRAMAKSPQAYEEMRKAVKQETGRDLPSYQEMYGGQASPSETDSTQSEQGQGQGVAAGQQPAPEAGSKGLTERDVFRLVEDKQATDRFLDKYPDYDPLKVEDMEQREKRFQNLQEIRFIAANFRALPRYAGITQDRAYELAHQAMNLDSVVQMAQEAGELGGEQRVLNKNTGAVGGISAGGEGNAGAGVLTPEDKLIMKKTGLDKIEGGKEAYLKHKAQK